MTGKSAFTEHPRWCPLTAWAFVLHANSRVASACLRLQDEHGLDVCVVLACAWYGVERRAELPTARLRELHRAVEPLAGWTARLRVLRRELARSARGDADLRRLYEATKATELEAEVLELGLLHDAIAADPPGDLEPNAAAASCLRRYAALTSPIGLGADADALLTELIAALPAPSAP